MGPPYGKLPKDMGIVWEAYHKGVPLLGVPGITLDCIISFVIVSPHSFFHVLVPLLNL